MGGGQREMAQCLRRNGCFSNLGSVPSITWQLTVLIYSSRGTRTLLWLLPAPGTQFTYIHAGTTLTHKMKIHVNALRHTLLCGPKSYFLKDQRSGKDPPPGRKDLSIAARI